MDKRPILIAGPTASGKSALALRLARARGGVVINADALQVYGCWRVLTARPDAREERQAPHLLYGHVARDAPYSVGHWLRDVARILHGDPRPPVIVGGTGLYFMALTEGLAEIPPTPAEVRADADLMAAADLLAELRARDPETVAAIDTANPARLRRAWEVLTTTGRGLAHWHRQTPPPLIPPQDAVLVHLHSDRDWLSDRIDRRFDAMIEAGALDEVRAYMAHGWDPALPSAQAIGARELAAHLQGASTLAQAVAAAKIQTRQYAKRQRSWFRKRMAGWRQVGPADTERAFQEIATDDA